MINVTRTYLPPRKEFDKYIDQIWKNHWLTNNGPLLKELEMKLKKFLGVPYLQFTSNGTIAIQIALRALGISRKVITTPFSYVATTSSILWEGCEPVFVDIDRDTLCINPALVEAAIDDETEAILATHVFGLPCDVTRLEEIGRRRNIKVIYDAAHAFGCTYQNKSLLDYGDAATCSFHATKLFHTGEGGCIIVHDSELDKKINLKKSFGHIGDEHFALGINGKNSELHASMGLAVLPHLDRIIAEREDISGQYDYALGDTSLVRPKMPKGLKYNFAYYPILFQDESSLLRVRQKLISNDITPRRYFWPSLEQLPYIQSEPCPVSDSVASRVLCLPLYNGLTTEEIDLITGLIRESL